jgi:toxin HigB-1
VDHVDRNVVGELGPLDLTAVVHIAHVLLRSFKDRETEAIWHRQRSRRLDGPTQRVAWRKLAMLDAAELLADLRVPPGNRLGKLTGDRSGQYSIRVNRQWRICFSWSDAGPEDVEIVDYHRRTRW